MPGLTIEEMNEIVEASRSDFKKGFRETQLLKDYALKRYMESIAQTINKTHELEWAIRRTGITGSVEWLNEFEGRNYVRAEYDTSMRIRPVRVSTHGNMIFDKHAMDLNEDSPNRIWNEYQMKASAAEEEAAEIFENAFLNAPPTPEGSKNGLLGLLAWFARSMTSGGVFVPQPRPQRNGVYRRYSSTGVSAVVGNLDASLAENSRLRSMVATHNGVMDANLLETIDDALRDSGRTYLSQLKGDTEQGALKLLMDDQFYRQYDRMLSDAGAPKTRDWYASGPVTVSGVSVMPVPNWDGHFLRPIIGIRPNILHPVMLKGMQKVAGKEQINHSVMAYPEDSTLQVMCKDPSAAGFLIHGEFTTGT